MRLFFSNEINMLASIAIFKTWILLLLPVSEPPLPFFRGVGERGAEGFEDLFKVVLGTYCGPALSAMAHALPTRRLMKTRAGTRSDALALRSTGPVSAKSPESSASVTGGSGEVHEGLGGDEGG